MSIERSLLGFSDEAESLLERFESTWLDAAKAGFTFEPDVGLWSLSAPVEERWGVLLELIAVDLEMRWRYGRGQQRVESYVRRMEALSTDNVPTSLILEEYRARCRWGDPPSRSEFIARFPWIHHLADELAAVDADLCLEGAFPTGEHDIIAPLSSHDYLLRRQLGAGGAARVYTAVQRSLDKVVAVKVLKKRWRNDERAVQRFLTEARVAAQLRHPQIVDVHGLGRLRGGELFMVMDLVQGKSLRDAIQQNARWPWAEALRIARDVASILEAVHAQGYLHADVTPANILLDGDHVPYLTDFGMSVPRNAPSPSHGATPQFAAPEQSAREPLGPETDVYGLGATLAAMVTGTLDWRLDDIDTPHRPLLQAALASKRHERLANPAEFLQAADRQTGAH